MRVRLAAMLALLSIAACAAPPSEGTTDTSEPGSADTSTADPDAPSTPPPCACSPTDDTPCARNRCQTDGTCAMTPEPDGTPCEDGDPCTLADTCQKGACTAGKTNACECLEQEDCKPLEDGDACNGTLLCDKQQWPWRCRVDPTTVVKCADAANPCKISACTPETGKCTTSDRPDGAGCDDGDACTKSDVCAAGQCAGKQSCTCKTNADCKASEDGNPCNGTLFCEQKSSKCVVNPVTIVACDSSGDTLCKKNTCQPATGLCVPTAVPGTVGCDDGDACTAGDHCSGGLCAPGKSVCTCKSDKDCVSHDDGDLCNGVMFCDLATGSCKDNPGSVVSCTSVGDTACAHNVCLPKEGTCAMAARADVTEVCADEPQVKGGVKKVCKWQLKSGKNPGNSADKGPFGCDDGDPCTSGEVCAGTACKASAVTCKCKSSSDCVDKDDGNLCNGTLFCDKSLKVPDCVLNPASKVFCSKKDDTDCLKAQCDPKTGACGLQPVASGAACDDGKPCTAATTCGGDGACGGGKATVCDDKDLCTVDSCVPGVGCKHAAKSCSDGNSCTLDGCDAKTGQCKLGNRPDGAVCNADNDGCTVNDACEKGACKVGKKLECSNVTKACEEPACVNKGPFDFTCGAVAKADGAPCDSPGACMQGAVCKAGKCGAATEPGLFVKVIGPADGWTMFRGVASRSDGVLLVSGAQRAKAGAGQPKALTWALSRRGKALWTVESKGPKEHAGAVATHVRAVGPGGIVLARVGGADGKLAAQLKRLDDKGSGVWTLDLAKTGADVGAFGLQVNAAGASLVGVMEEVIGKKIFAMQVRRVSPLGKEQWAATVKDDAPGMESTVDLAWLPDGRFAWVHDHVYNFGGGNNWGRGITVHDTAGKQVFSNVSIASQPSHSTAIVALSGGELAYVGHKVRKSVPMVQVARFSKVPQERWKVDKPHTALPKAAVRSGKSGFSAVGSQATKGNSDLWLGVFDDVGNLQRDTAWDSGAQDFGESVDVTADGALVAVGWSAAKVETGPRRGVLAVVSPFLATSCGAEGKCAGKGFDACADGKECTVDTCAAELGCVNAAQQAMLCEPQNGCSETAKCVGETCVADPNGRVFIRPNDVGSYYGIGSSWGLHVDGTGFSWLAHSTGSKDAYSVAVRSDAGFHHVNQIDQPGCGSGKVKHAAKHPGGYWYLGITDSEAPDKPRVCAFSTFKDAAKAELSVCTGCKAEFVRIRPIAKGGSWSLLNIDGAKRVPMVQLLASKGGLTASVYLEGCGDGVCSIDEKAAGCDTDCAATKPPDPSPTSCAGRCGQYVTGAKCQCDHTCATYGDCCTDKVKLCDGALKGTGRTTATNSKVRPDAALAVTMIVTYNSRIDAAVAVVDLKGKTLWRKQWQGGKELRPMGLDVDASGAAVLSGELVLNDEVSTHFVARVADGKISWQKGPKLPDMGRSTALRLLDDGGFVHSGSRLVASEQKVALWRCDVQGNTLFARIYESPDPTMKLVAGEDELIALPDGFGLLTFSSAGSWAMPALIRTDLSGHASCVAAGLCAKATKCDDGKACTADFCDPKAGCKHVPIAGCSQGA